MRVVWEKSWSLEVLPPEPHQEPMAVSLGLKHNKTKESNVKPWASLEPKATQMHHVVLWALGTSVVVEKSELLHVHGVARGTSGRDPQEEEGDNQGDSDGREGCLRDRAGAPESGEA